MLYSWIPVLGVFLFLGVKAWSGEKEASEPPVRFQVVSVGIRPDGWMTVPVDVTIGLGGKMEHED